VIKKLAEELPIENIITDKNTSDMLRSFPKDEELEGLNRYAKGFWYEMFNQKLLETNHIGFSGNPNSFSNWMESQIKGYDLKVRLPNGKTIKLECKLLLKPIFHSWFMRDWLTRDADVFVTNDAHSIPYGDRRTLQKHRKKLLSTTEFIVYLSKLMKRGNNQKVESYSTTTNINKYLLESKYRVLSFRIWLSKILASLRSGLVDNLVGNNNSPNVCMQNKTSNLFFLWVKRRCTHGN
jgi:hypothetical protein